MPVAVQEPQHMQALAQANHKRIRRAEVKRDVGAGRVSVLDLLEDYPPELDNMPVAEILRSINRWGTIKARGFLKTHHISESRTFSQLSERQRQMLREALERRGVR